MRISNELLMFKLREEARLRDAWIRAKLGDPWDPKAKALLPVADYRHWLKHEGVWLHLVSLLRVEMYKVVLTVSHAISLLCGRRR